MADNGKPEPKKAREWIPASFFPVSPLMIFPEAMGTFSVYLRQGSEFVLYTTSGQRFTEEHRQTLYQSGVEDIYVQTVEKPDFDQYVEDNLGRMLDNEDVPLHERCKILTKATENVLSETFGTKLPTTLNPEHFQRVGTIIRQSLRFLSDERALKALGPFISHDYRTYTHSMNVFLFTMSILNTYDMEEEELYQCGLGAMLHDIGKTRIPKEILNKKGKLTPQERTVIETHPLQGVALCASLDISQTTFNCILFHHERVDGNGYPSGIPAEDIPIPVRAISLADVYDALTSNRPYAKALPAFKALTLMRHEMMGFFDMEVFKRFVEILAGADLA